MVLSTVCVIKVMRRLRRGTVRMLTSVKNQGKTFVWRLARPVRIRCPVSGVQECVEKGGRRGRIVENILGGENAIIVFRGDENTHQY